ncbi:MAG: hypothetical protein GF346_10880, partial [Candidatus Eisenbacteria bacterium]|nr:hypothetical protein [Candidatus Latescibacterota bacterium]MBD3302941.1 hypothetical protein [Candidatus Eisenbacteria bacterium]
MKTISRAVRIAPPILALLLLATGIPGSSARSASRSVEADGTGAHPTIQSAIDAAQPGDTIRVGPGTYTG